MSITECAVYCFATWILTVTELELNLGRVAPTFASGFKTSTADWLFFVAF